MRQRKQPGTGFMCRLVFGPETEKARYEDTEGVSVRQARHHADDWFLPLANLAFYDSKRSSDLILAHGRGKNVKALRGMQSTERVSRGEMLIPVYASTTTFDAAAALRAAWLSFGHSAFRKSVCASVRGRVLPPRVSFWQP